jgi:hypothetical protein
LEWVLSCIMREGEKMSKLPQKKRIYLSPPHMGGRELEFINEAFETSLYF